MKNTSSMQMTDLKPWLEFNWPAEQQRCIERSWGQAFARLRRNTAAQKYFDRCIDGHPGEDYAALYLRSKFNRSVARPHLALLDGQRAAAVSGPCDVEINLELCDTHYDLNQFEDNKIMLHNGLRKYSGSSMKPFEHRLNIVNQNFDTALGESLAPFLLKNSENLNSIAENIRGKGKEVTERPRWKVLKEQNECDVQSIMDKQEEMLSPLEQARRKRKSKIYYQSYLNHAWTDIFFLKELRKNRDWLIDQHTDSTAYDYLNTSFDRIKTFTKMLHARQPMYSKSFYKQNDVQLREFQKEANLFRIQYQTRRNMFSILKTVRQMRSRGETQRLRKFVEEVMGEYVVVKTRRVMPWKIEFMYEMYNNLALCLCDDFHLPTTKVTPYDKNALCNLLNVMPLKPADQPEFVFGDRSTYDDGEVTTEKKNIKRMLAHMEKRLFFAKEPIERTYLLHEVADLQMQQNHFVQSMSSANAAIEQARRCNSKIWEFLSLLMMAKSNAVLHKYERQTEVLDSAYELVKQLKSPHLCTFIELCRMLNSDYITLRKMSQAMANKRHKIKSSNRSSRVSSSHPSSNDVSKRKSSPQLLLPTV